MVYCRPSDKRGCFSVVVYCRPSDKFVNLSVKVKVFFFRYVKNVFPVIPKNNLFVAVFMYFLSIVVPNICRETLIVVSL